MTQGLARFGDTRQRLLRQLLLSRDGAGVEDLCDRLRITHNAVRQHLTTLIVNGLVERVQPRATGGRPQACYALTAAGRELFPRNYGAIAAALISQLLARVGEAEVSAMLQELGTTVAATQAPLQADGSEALARALAQRLDALGYEAVPRGTATTGRSRRSTACSTAWRGSIRRSASSTSPTWRRPPAAVSTTWSA